MSTHMIDCDDDASVSDVSSQASSSSSLLTFQADRHSTARSRLGRARSVGEQLEDLAHQDSPVDLSELPKIFVGKETFVLESSTRRRKKRSEIDAFGTRLTKIDGAGNGRGDYWVRSKCDPPATGLLIGYQDLSIQYNSVQYQYKIELTYQYQYKMNPHLVLN